MKIFTKFRINALLFCVIVLTFFSCATVQANLIEHQERMFWELQGEKSSVYLLGTIHLADDSFFPIEENVIEAFDNSEIIYAELSDSDLVAIAPVLQVKIFESTYGVPENKRAINFLTDDEIELVEKVLPSEMHLVAKNMEPWVLGMLIDEVFLSNYNYSGDQGIDMFFYERADQNGRKVNGLDSIQTQVSVLTEGTLQDQVFMLKYTLQKIKSGDYEKEVKHLFDSYQKNDKEGLAKALSPDYPDTAPKGFEKRYTNTLLVNRNKDWVKKILNFLKNGQTVFIYAGAGHFVGKDSVFAIMKENGNLK